MLELTIGKDGGAGALREDRVERALVEACARVHGRAIKLSPDHCKGLPDRLCLFPGGRVCFVELKRPKGGRVAPMQEYRHAQLRAMGFDVRVIHTREGIDALVRDYATREE